MNNLNKQFGIFRKNYFFDVFESESVALVVAKLLGEDYYIIDVTGKGYQKQLTPHLYSVLLQPNYFQ
jgi:hypothetical protein